MKSFVELEDYLTDVLSDKLPNFTIEVLEDNSIVIFTGLADDDGELIDLEDDYDIDIELLEDEEEVKDVKDDKDD